MNYFALTQTTPDVLKKIEKAEAEGRFSEHLDPIDYSLCEPVTKDFPYVPSKELERSRFLKKWFIVRPYMFIVNHFILRTRVFGRENIKGIKSAVVTGNHVNKLDAVAIWKACRHKSFKVMVGDFNNQKAPLGDYMRIFGILPFSPDRGAFKAFDKAITHYLNNDTYVLFFPECSEWWCYEKPRPYMDGAFHYAVKNKVPVIPTFITFTHTGKYFKNGIEKRYFNVHILKPIYADEQLSDSENIKRMKEENMRQCAAKYEEFYK